MQPLSNENLTILRTHFLKHQRDIRFVGGCVRDHVHGTVPHDIDLCTNATPDEQIRIYQQHDVRYHETGIKHGTLTAVFDGNQTYEITSLRRDTKTNGRHAVVAYTRDWIADLSRRDLTINAMSMTFDGDLIDPFGGQHDLKHGRVRFVGDPMQRMQEDYLRILRWLRFHGRFAQGQELDPAAAQAAKSCATGLANISRERIWQEFAKIISGPAGPDMIDAVFDLKLNKYMYFSVPSNYRTRLQTAYQHTNHPVSLMVAMLHSQKLVQSISAAWKWSNQEQRLAKFLVEHVQDAGAGMTHYKILLAVHGIELSWVKELARLNRDILCAECIAEWPVPQFPINGNDLLEIGYTAGPIMKQYMLLLKQTWAKHNFEASRDEVLDWAKSFKEQLDGLDAYGVNDLNLSIQTLGNR